MTVFANTVEVLVPLHTILIVGGSWIVLLVLTIWYYRRGSDGEGE